MINLEFEDLSLLGQLYSEDTEWMKRIEEIQYIFNCSFTVHVRLFKNVLYLSRFLNIEVPNWVKGASVGRDILLIDQKNWVQEPDERLTDILVHEYAHVIINKKSCSSCPLWLNEALAIYFAHQTCQYNLFVCKPDFNYYQKNCFDDFFYQYCALAISALLCYYDIGKIINKISQADSVNDEIIGSSNIERIVNNYLGQMKNQKIEA